MYKERYSSKYSDGAYPISAYWPIETLSYGIPVFKYRFKAIKSLFFKRCLDVVLSLILLIALSPILGVIAYWIKWVSKTGPIFCCQDRISLNGHVFRLYKFRSMLPDAESTTGPVIW